MTNVCYFMITVESENLRTFAEIYSTIMGRITVRKVETAREMRDFARFANNLYKDNPCYVPELESDVKDTFDREKNKNMQGYSESQPFVAYDSMGEAVGRVVALVNYNANKKWNTKATRFGYLDFIDDAEVSKELMQTVAEWGKTRGMNCMEGPMGLYDFDKEGMLVEDFDRPSSMIEIYNAPYYPQHMEAMGFEKAADWLQVRIKVPKTVPPIYQRVARYVTEMYHLHVRKLTNSEIVKQGYGHRIFHLLNDCYDQLFGYTEIPQPIIDEYVRNYIQLVDKQLIPIVENEKGELVGVAVTMGSLNHALQKAGGKLFPTGWMHLLHSLKFSNERTAQMLLVAVRKDYQGIGVNALFFTDLIPIYNKMGFEWAETGPQLENNLRVLSQWKPLHPDVIKRRRCYKKTID